MSVKSQNLKSNLSTKSEYLNSKQILVSQISKFQTYQFGTLGFRIWDLFRISDLGFRILTYVMTFCILIFGFWISTYAAACYGTKLPEKKEFFTGLQSHTIFKRYLEDNYGKLRSAQYLLLLSYGVFDWLSIDLKGGVGNIKQHPVGSDEVDYTTNFAGGYGFRLKFYDRKNFKMVFGFQHISVHPKSTHLGSVKNKAILDDWQTSLLASRDFKKIAPYLGTRWSRIDYIHTQGDSRKRKMSDFTKDIGFIYGFDVPLTKEVWINLEGSAFDSEAFAFSVNYKF